MGGDLLLGTIFSPRQGQSQMGDLRQGWSQMRGDLEKLSSKTKNAPYMNIKIRANFGVLNIK